MSRIPPSRSPLPDATGWAIPVFAFGASGVVASGVGLLAESPLMISGAISGVLLASAATITLNCQYRRRLELLDAYLLKLSPVLGWPGPDRYQLTARGWHDGWVGTPRRLRLRFNPLADENVPEIISQARSQAQRLFGSKYKVSKQNDRRGLLLLVQVDSAAEADVAVQVDRVKTVTGKIFGSGSNVKTKFTDGGELREITVSYEVTPRLSSRALRGRIESQITDFLPGRWRSFWDLQSDTVRFEIRPHLADYIANPSAAPDTEPDPRATYDDLEVPVAMDEDGNLIVWRPKRDPHGLITGKTGKGKTVVLLGIIMYLAAQGWKIWGIDGKRIELLGLREHPNVQLIAGRVDHQARVAHEMYEMMQRRFEQYEAGLVKLEEFEPVLFVIDEYKTFRNAVTRWYRSVKPKGSSTLPPTIEEISDFVSLARKARMHLVLGLQRPDAEFLTGDMRDNFNFRMSFGRLSPEGAKMMWDSFSIGIAIPPFARGRGTAQNSHGVPVEVQSFWTPDPYQTDPDNPSVWVFPEDLQIIERLRPKHRLHSLQRIIDPEEAGDWADLDGKSSKTEPDFNDYMASRIVSISEDAARPVRKMAGVFIRPREQELELITAESEEADEVDEDDLFAGYAAGNEMVVEELLDDSGELSLEGAVALLDPDNDTWGLIDFIEQDAVDEDYLAVSYRDFITGEPSMISLPGTDVFSVRLPKSAATS